MFVDPFQEKIWKDKYQYNDETFDEFCERIAYTIFSDDKERKDILLEKLKNFEVLFGGRINSNIGIPEEGLTLFNCFIEAIVEEPDSLEGIMEMVTKYALTLKTEGGVGFCADFFRPAKTIIRKIGVTSPGAIKFLEIFDKVSEVITSGGVSKDNSFQGLPTKNSIRKGATMVTMSISHPDIEEFITAKSVPNRLTKMNMSVLVTDEFIDAVKNDTDWDLWFPDINCEQYDKEWDGNLKRWKEKNYPVIVYKTIRAVELWDLIMKNSYCVPGDLIIPAYINGIARNMSIEEIHKELAYGSKIEVISVNNNTLELEKKEVINSIYKGKKELLEIKTNSNLIYRCTKDHRLFGVKTGELLYDKKASDFENGDYIARVNKTSLDMYEEAVDDDWEIFLGLLLGDGSVRNGGVRVAVNSLQLSEIKPLLDRIANRYGREVKIYTDKRSENWVELNIFSIKLSEDINKYMYKEKFMGQKSSIKIIPRHLFTTSNIRSVKNFISGYFSADGCINNQKCTFYSKYKHIAEGIQKLLLRLGVVSKMYGVHHKNLDVHGYRVDIDIVNCDILINSIGNFLVNSKVNKYVVSRKYKAPIRIMAYDETKSFSNKAHLFKVGGTTDKNNFPKKYEALFDGNVRYEKITDIKMKGSVDVYDISVVDNQNFICNFGGLYHNCRNEPGVLFIDNARRMNNLWYLDGDLISTNPCVVEGTMVATNNGLIPVENLSVGDEVQTTLGFGRIKEIKSYENQDIYRVYFGDGFHQDVTKGHIFHTMFCDIESRKKWSNTERLFEIDTNYFVRKEWYKKYPTVNNDLSRDDGLLLGLYLGDGCYSNYSGFNISVNSTENNSYIKNLFSKVGGGIRIDESEGNCQRYYLINNKPYLDSLFNQLCINPNGKKINLYKILNTNKEFIQGLIDGLISSDGNINLTSRYPQIRFENTNLEIHILLKHLLLFVKADYKIYKKGTPGRSTINGRFIKSNLDSYTGVIDNDSILNFYNELGYVSHENKNEKLIEIIKNCQLNGVKWKTKIKSIEYIGKGKVYDIYEPIADDWNHEGYVSRGCSEIFGHTGIEKINNQELLLGDVCCLGSVNITKFYSIEENKFCVKDFCKAVDIMVRALDNVIDISNYPLPMYENAAKLKRKVGVGITGIGSLLMMMNLRYGSEESVDVLAAIMSEFINQAYKSSALLAAEKGPFDLWDFEAVENGFIRNSGVLRSDVIELIKSNGLRNSALTAIAPNGTLSILAGNVSGGLEPVFATEFTRWNRVEGKPVDFKYPNVHKGEWFENDYFKEQKVADETVLMSKDGEYRIDRNNGLCKKIVIQDYGYKMAKEAGHAEFATAMELSVDEHLNILRLLTKYNDQSASKTINLVNGITFEDFKKLYSRIHEYGIKGCTTYREGTSVAVLEAVKKEQAKSIRKQQKEFLAAFKNQENDDIIFDNVELPDEYPAKGYILTAEGSRKWYLHCAFKDKAHTRPFAIFVNTNAREDNVLTFNALEKLEELALSKGLKVEFIEDTKRKYAYQKNPVKICRMLGLLLRHNISVFAIVQALRELGATVGTFVFHITKFLSGFVEEHEVEGKVCPECGEKSIRFSEGCFACSNPECMYSRCG